MRRGLTRPVCVYERMIPEEDKDCAYTDNDLTFVMHVYRNGNLADWSLGNLRKHYPTSRVIVISDGDTDPLLDTFANKHGVEFQRTDRLILIEKGTDYILNYMSQFLKNPTKYMIKIDPDTGFHRRFKYVPTYDVFGCVGYLRNIGPTLINGGLFGFSGDAVKEIYESDIFSNPELDIHPWGTRRKLNIELMREDITLMEACYLLGMDIGPFPEVFISLQYKPNRKLRYAVTHPCKGYKL